MFSVLPKISFVFILVDHTRRRLSFSASLDPLNLSFNPSLSYIFLIWQALKRRDKAHVFYGIACQPVKIEQRADMVVLR